MVLKAVTFDFWATLYQPHFARKERLDLLEEALARHGEVRSRSDLEDAMGQAWDEVQDAWRHEHSSPGIRFWLQTVQRVTGTDLPETSLPSLHSALESVYLAGDRPRPVHGVAEVVPLLAERYRLGVISDTGLTPGRVLGEILRRDGLRDYFDTLAFSDDVGVTKPERRIFEYALEGLGVGPEEAIHVGDLPETDLVGARAVGMRAVLFLGESRREDGRTLADASFDAYHELPALLEILS